MTTSRPLQRSISAVPCEPGGLRGTGLERVRVPETTGVLPRRRTEACRRTMPRFILRQLEWRAAIPVRLRRDRGSMRRSGLEWPASSRPIPECGRLRPRSSGFS